MKTGFFISCRKGKENKAFKEFVNSASLFFEHQGCHKDYTTINVYEEIENDIRIMKKSVFSLYYTYKSIMYVANLSEISSTLLFLHLRNNGHSFYYIQRIVPIEKMFHYKENFIECCKDMKYDSYKIVYEERFAPDHIKTIVFDAITNAVDIKVDLVNPRHKVVVQVLKTSVGISLLTDYTGTFNFAKG